MKNHLDKNRYRLADTEREELFARIEARRQPPQFWARVWPPRPALAGAVVILCGAVIGLIAFDGLHQSPDAEFEVARRDVPKSAAQSPIASRVDNIAAGQDQPADGDYLARNERFIAAPVEADEDVALKPSPGEGGRGRDKNEAETLGSRDVTLYGQEARSQSGDQVVSLAKRGAPQPIIVDGGEHPGGNVPPNGKPYDLVYHEHYGVNPFITTEEDALSTFALDVDNASYTITRRYLRDGHLPAKEAVRVEEFVNFFEPGYPAVGEGDFAIRVDGAPSPWGEGYHLLRIGIQGRDIAAAERRPANLVFVVDISGSMNRENRLGLVKQALKLLLDELDPRDSVGLVVYGSQGRVLLTPTSVEERDRLIAAIEELQPGGSTNVEEGLNLAYDMARRNYQRRAINRVIVCSDGVANTGQTAAEQILNRVRGEADRGISLSTIGFGMGNYNDVLMEKLADQGDGNYYYVDELKEAERVFRENLTGMLQVLGRDAKVQVQFDPRNVLRYRLLGYENRDVADRDFRNDAVDAGEIGAGHVAVALYEVKLSDPVLRYWSGEAVDMSPVPLATVRLRYELPAHVAEGAGEVIELEKILVSIHLVDRFTDAAPRLQLAAVVAEFAEILRGSYWARDNGLNRLLPAAENLVALLPEDPAVSELRDLIRRAAAIQAAADED